MEQKKQVIRKLRQIRMSKCTATELERESGFSISQISHIESGRKDIQLSTLIRYCEAVGIEIIFKRIKETE